MAQSALGWMLAYVLKDGLCQDMTIGLAYSVLYMLILSYVIMKTNLILNSQREIDLS